MSGAFPPKVMGAGEGKTVMLFGVRFGYKVVSGDSGGRLAVLEVEIPAGTLVKPHSHAREDEFSLVLAGTVLAVRPWHRSGAHPASRPQATAPSHLAPLPSSATRRRRAA